MKLPAETNNGGLMVGKCTEDKGLLLADMFTQADKMVDIIQSNIHELHDVVSENLQVI